VKKIVLNFIFLFIFYGLNLAQVPAQVPDNYRYVKNWKITDRLGSVDSIKVDTVHLNFQTDNYIDRFSIANAVTGELGSPINSKIYFNRPADNDFIFSNAYYPYLQKIESNTFYNTKTPFSSLKYLSGGTQYREEEEFGFIFTANANKKTNFGINLDYIYARGEYADQAAKRMAVSLFGSHNGKHYTAYGTFSINNLSNYENGGITDESYITDPLQNTSAEVIPTNIVGYSNFRQTQLFYNQQYSIGIERKVKVGKDSVGTEYVPVTRFIHTLQFDDTRKRYYESSVESTFYKNTYLPYTETNDTSALQTLTNRLAINLAEKFNKWMRFGLTGYIENEVQRFTFVEDSTLFNQLKSNTKVGGILAKELGQKFTYKILGEIDLLGYKAGDFNLQGNVKGAFNLWKNQIILSANGFIKSEEPSLFLQYYHSNHFRWENDFDKTYRTHVGGNFSIPTKNFSLGVDIENITQQIYFDTEALPAQYSGNVQIASANLELDFHVGKFTLENNAVYQLSSNQEVLPLPNLCLYHNFYYHDKWFNVLSMQIGTEVRYHTSYYAPSYMPAIGQFYNQRDTEVGNYPVINVYLNAHLKRTRFFAEYYHVNQLFMTGAYFSMPNYPINPAIFKMGLTWNFYD
jgi:hypothetical protein